MSRFYGDFDPASTASTAILTVTSAVSLYLPFDTDFSDLSNFNHSPTVAGNTVIQTSTAQFQASAFFDGNDDYVTYPNHSSFLFGTDDFTVEGFFNASSVGSDGLLGIWGGPSSGLRCWLISFSLGNLYAAFSLDGNSATSLNSGVTVSTGQWYNFSFTREGSTFRLFVDGVLKATATNSGGLKNSSQNLAIGSNNQSLTTLEYHGFLDDIRITKGLAVYTTAYSVPTGPVGFITDTRTHSHVWNYPDVYDARFAGTWPTIDTGPTTLSHLIRYDASMPDTVDTAAGTWTSVSGSQHPTTLVNGTTATLLIADQNGLNVVRTNTSFVVTSADQVSTITSAYGFAMVYSRNVATSAQDIYPFGTGPGNDAHSLGIEIHSSNTGGADFDVAGGNSYDRTVSVAGADFQSADYTRYLIMASANSSDGIHNAKVQVRGGTSSAVTLGTSGSNRGSLPRFFDSSFKTGAFSGAQQLDICEMIFYDVELSSADMITEADRLATKWGL